MLYVVRLSKISGLGTKLTFSTRKSIGYGNYSKDAFVLFGHNNVETNHPVREGEFFKVKKIYPKVSSYMANYNWPEPEGSSFARQFNKYYNATKNPIKVYLEVEDAS